MIASFKKREPEYVLLISIFLLSLLAAAYFEMSWLVIIGFAAAICYASWQQPQLAFYLLLLSIPFSFEYNFSPTLGTDIPDEGLMLIVSFLFLAYWIFNPLAIRKEDWQHPLILFLLIHLGWILITTIVSTDTLPSVKYLLAKTWYVGAFVLAPLILFQSKKKIIMTAILVALSMFAVALIALIRHAQSGFRFATINEAVAPFFRNHVNYSSMLVCLVPVFIAFYQSATKRVLKYTLSIAIIILLAALLFSYSRGAWLALGTGFAAWWLIRKKRLLIAFAIVLALIIGAISWLKAKDRYLAYAHDFNTTVFHEDFREHLVATYQLKDVSTAERFYRWVAGVRMIKDSWLYGFGPGTFYEQYKPYGVPAYKTWISDNKEHSTVHNYFLLLTIEQGLPGLLFFLLLLGGMMYYAQQMYHRSEDPFYKTVSITVGIIVVMITTVNLLSDLVETDKVGSVFLLCLALLVKLR